MSKKCINREEIVSFQVLEEENLKMPKKYLYKTPQKTGDPEILNA